MLPLEIRTNIYRLLLCQPTPIGLVRCCLHPAILRASRQLYTEGKDFLYENTFEMKIWDKVRPGARIFYKLRQLCRRSKIHCPGP